MQYRNPVDETGVEQARIWRQLKMDYILKKLYERKAPEFENRENVRQVRP